MGQWNISIQGHGIHDNGRQDDIDVMLAKWIEEVRKHHEVESVFLTVGSSRKLTGNAV